MTTTATKKYIQSKQINREQQKEHRLLNRVAPLHRLTVTYVARCTLMCRTCAACLMSAYKTCSRVAVARFYSPFDCVDVRTTTRVWWDFRYVFIYLVVC